MRPELKQLTTPRLNNYIPHQPTAKQAAFLLVPQREAFYGGAAGGGKSDALLMAALQYVDVPGYAAILFRRTYADLALPGALMDRAQEWLAGTDAKWNAQDHTWTFPGGPTLTFGYLEHENDRYRYQSAEFQFIGFDELTHFSESQYRYLFSRLRRLAGAPVPLRMRAASNPGGVGHDWVRQRFLVEGPSKGRIFIPARLEDNPHIDAEEYERSLRELDPFNWAQLRRGDWEARPAGTKFKREWFEIVDAAPAEAKQARYWDMAATEAKPGKDPDYTAGVLVAEKDGVYYVLDVRRVRLTPKGVEELVRQTAEMDGRKVNVHIEQEPGSAGVSIIDHYQRRVLKGFAVYAHRTTGSKELRANPVSAAAQAGNIKLVRGRWINDLLDEVEAFPGEGHDDQVDALSGAVAALTNYSGTTPASVGKPSVWTPMGSGATGGSKWRQ